MPYLAAQLGQPRCPLSYLIGALQFRALHKELVDSGRMSNRDFHDRILRNGSIPVEMVRAALTDQVLSKAYATSWKFYGSPIADGP